MKVQSPHAYPELVSLTFVLPWEKKTGKATAKKFFEGAKYVDELWEDEELGRGMKKSYEWSLGASHLSPLYLDVGLLSRKKDLWGMRVITNPFFDAQALEDFAFALNGLVDQKRGSTDCKLLVEAVSCNVDIEGIALNDLLVQFQHRDWQTFQWRHTSSTGTIKKLSYGAVSGQYVGAYMDRTTSPNRSVLKAMALSQLPVLTARQNTLQETTEAGDANPSVQLYVERSYRGLGKSLDDLPNPFADFVLGDGRAINAAPDQYASQSFAALCRELGVNSALSLSNEGPSRDAVQKLWESSLGDWWSPEACWDRCRKTAKRWTYSYRVR